MTMPICWRSQVGGDRGQAGHGDPMLEKRGAERSRKWQEIFDALSIPEKDALSVETVAKLR